MEELEHSVSIKIAKEPVMNINKPGSLFKPTNGFLETKVYFAGLPRKVENALIRPVMSQACTSVSFSMGEFHLSIIGLKMCFSESQ